MKIFSTITEIRKELNLSRIQGKSVGLVPTMGALHEGHLSLVRRSVDENDLTVASIYVNPTQFSPNEDFEAYPRQVEKDSRLLERIGVDVVFSPSDQIMYPEGFQTFVNVREVTKGLCGGSRPEHFQGVTTIVMKLFNLVSPCRAYFGQKDYQQVTVIRRMVMDLNVPVKIVSCPIVRDQDGLALSSRNQYLTREERKIAPFFYEILKWGKDELSSQREIKDIKTDMVDKLNDKGFAPDYVDFVHPLSLKPIEEVSPEGIVIVGAVFLNRVRLIDNIVVGHEEN